MTTLSQPQQKRFIRLPVVKDKTGQGRSSIYDGVAAGTFPAPVKIGSRAVAWLEHEVDAWIDARVQAARDAR
ncbi:helix-turn-helix transcriptional regulator [Bordetella tumulicola]|uniref:helix-turn-helix transcriptional regulator n=1 Tax=Bordetella tumulicola TaxID=1649133 RepID=UPI0039EF2322